MCHAAGTVTIKAMRLAEVVETSNAVAGVSGRLEKIERLAALLTRAAPEPDELETAVAFLSGSSRQGRIGVGWSALSQVKAAAVAASESTLQLRDVDEAFARISAASGAGSTRERGRVLADLLARATAAEQDFLLRLLFGGLRQGALEGVLIEAVARAAHVPADIVRRAAMMAGDLGVVARTAFAGGEAALTQIIVQMFRPVQPMLAESAESVDEALTWLDRASVELKLDGARIQVHKAGDDVKVFSRTLREVTGAVPEVVDIVRALPAREIILDGEVIALRPDATPEPFQVTMQRFGRRLDVDRLRREMPLTPFFFDALYLDGQALIDETQSRRADVMSQVLPPEIIIPRIVSPTKEQAQAFLDNVLRRGHEGAMAKSLDAPYAAGRRGQAWLKIKQARTLDLVVIGVEWGSGRRQGWLSNIHMGARDPERNAFVMLGKTFKGMTDEMLAWQTEQFLAREIGRDAYTVYVRPEVVVEIAFNDVQESSQYPGGLALRFARVKRYRSDKTAAESDTFATVQEIYRRTTGREPPLPRESGGWR
jgi:DNA ligase 1